MALPTEAMSGADIAAIYDSVKQNGYPDNFTDPVADPFLAEVPSGVRANSGAVQGGGCGDEGKAAVVKDLLPDDVNDEAAVVRYGGGYNAGHGAYLWVDRGDGVPELRQAVFHGIPTGALRENTTAMIGRTTLFDPAGFMKEHGEICQVLNTPRLPGKVVIDLNTPLSLTTHKGFEGLMKASGKGGMAGSTGSGISPGYASILLKNGVSVGQLLDAEWKTHLTDHYKLWDRLSRDLVDGQQMSEMIVRDDGDRPVGTLEQFLYRVGEARGQLLDLHAKGEIDFDFRNIFRAIWHDPRIRLLFEGAQAGGLRNGTGLYPDVTVGPPFIHDTLDVTTYNIAHARQVPVIINTTKVPYMSSVGARDFHVPVDAAYVKKIQDGFGEKGQTTGRLRDVLPLIMSFLSYVHRSGQHNYLAVTHMDAASLNETIRVVTHFSENPDPRNQGSETLYSPYQHEIDAHHAAGNWNPQYVEFDPWDGTRVAEAQHPGQLDPKALEFLYFLKEAFDGVPLMMARTGRAPENKVMWI